MQTISLKKLEPDKKDKTLLTKQIIFDKVSWMKTLSTMVIMIWMIILNMKVVVQLKMGKFKKMRNGKVL